jgi:AraC-like DNA-binding protein
MADHLVITKGRARVRSMSAAPLIKLLAFIDAGMGVDFGPLHQQTIHALLPLPAGCRDDDNILRWFTGQLAQNDESITEVARALRGSESYQLIRFLLAADAVTSVEHLGEAYGLSASHFRRKCLKALGRPLKLELRLLRAARSLLDTSHRPRSFTRLAEDHGFASSAHFSSDIKGLTGMCPSEIYERKICGE